MKPPVENILFIQPDLESFSELILYLTQENINVVHTNESDKAIEILLANYFSVVIIDLAMLKILDFIKTKDQKSVVIVSGRQWDLDLSLQIYKKGAYEQYQNGPDFNSLKNIVLKALNHAKSLRGPSFKFPIHDFQKNHMQKVIGHSPKILELYKKISKASTGHSNVLILGESGTGKELVAKAIHANGDRCSGPFVAINCGALNDSLLESELFGHIKGSFTGAHRDKKGLFEEANNGTLFLDEIGEISAALQVKLLRALQEEEVRPVGSNITKKVNPRIISATNQDLEDMSKSGKFRQDLFYRLNVLKITLPPLRERSEDLPDLVSYFITKYAEKYAKKNIKISKEAMELILNYKWPGNIRELENAIEHAINMADLDQLNPEDFPQEVFESPLKNKSNLLKNTHTQLHEIEVDHIYQTLKAHNFNKSQTALKLGIDRTTLLRKIKKYNLESKSLN